ncbi:MAG: hypothetical protein H6607_02345 [Flavobacteriales bacterium]|nr:hypothetical protein [Flavobacteriales bacterium]
MKRLILFSMIAVMAYGCDSKEIGMCDGYEEEPTLMMENSANNDFYVWHYNQKNVGDTIKSPHYLPFDMNSDTMNYEFFRDTGSIGKLSIYYHIVPFFCDIDDKQMFRFGKAFFAFDSSLNAKFYQDFPIKQDTGYDIDWRTMLQLSF